MKRIEEGHSYAILCSEAEFEALPVGEPGPDVGDLAADYIQGLVVRRREASPPGSVCIYPVRLLKTLSAEDEASIREAAGVEWDATVPRWSMDRATFVQWHVDMATGAVR